MLEVLLLIIYMTAYCLLAGTCALRLLGRVLQTPEDDFMGIVPVLMAGVTALTVVMQYISVFTGIGTAVHFVTLGLMILAAVRCGEIRQSLRRLGRRIFTIVKSRRFGIYFLFILSVAFFSSRGEFHTDTRIYHAQAIAIIEKYGTIIGSGNFSNHLGYNSSSLVFASLFSLSDLLPDAAHVTTAFYMTVFGLYSVNGILNCMHSGFRLSAMPKAAILLYIMTDVWYANSPATDYAAMLFVMFLFSEWLSVREERRRGTETERYGLLALFSVFIVSVKLSAAFTVLFSLLPLIQLIRRKDFRKIALFVLLGFLVILPWLIRNVLITGWLIYPFASLDLFRVDWKIPKEILEKDAAQIRVWGQKLEDLSKADYSLQQWLPVWWDGQQHYEKILITAQFPAAAALILTTFQKLVGKQKLQADRIMLYAVCLCSLVLWFVQAPYVRYALAFLMVVPLCAAAEAFECRLTGPKFAASLGCFLAVFILTMFAPWIDNYMTDFGQFVKTQLREPYYLMQRPYEEPEEKAYDFGNGVAVYCTVSGEVTGYCLTPASCYEDMVERSEPRGNTVRDGFRPAD